MDEKSDRGVIFGFDTNKNEQAFLELGYEVTPRSYEGISVYAFIGFILILYQAILMK